VTLDRLIHGRLVPSEVVLQGGRQKGVERPETIGNTRVRVVTTRSDTPSRPLFWQDKGAGRRVVNIIEVKPVNVSTSQQKFDPIFQNRTSLEKFFGPRTV